MGDGMKCFQETFVGIEHVEDEHGDPTGEKHVLAQCNGNRSVDCGWRYRLDHLDRDVEDWYITSAQMIALHIEHRLWAERQGNHV